MHPIKGIYEMRCHCRLILILLLSFSTNFCNAQTTIFDEPLLSTESFNTFTNVSVTGDQGWQYTFPYGATCSGYVTPQNFENEDWLISPAINLYEADNVILTFKHSRGNASVVNVGVAEGWYKVFATADYTGDPATTQWVELSYNQTLTAAWRYVSSGDITLPDEVKSENSRIAFRYQCTAEQSAVWEIKNVKITGNTPHPANAVDFKITNWNTEWLGCATYGPADEFLQFSNIADAMLSMNADIYCLQEVTNSVAGHAIGTLLYLLGNEWDAKIVPEMNEDCEQRQAIVYKKSKVQFVSGALISSGDSAQGNSYYYNCASGRYPALYHVNLVAGNSLIPVSLVNIHAKAEDGFAMSYTRRLGASEALKTILDGADYNTSNLIFIGDFNDYLVGTTSNTCACTVSPYQNFTEDQTNYETVTRNIIDANTTWGTHPLIENIIISNELSQHYIPNSAAQEISVAQDIDSYFATTSDHLPVSARFQFTLLANPEFADTHRNSLSVIPNPVKDELKLAASGIEAGETAAIYDLTGRQIRCEMMHADSMNVSALPVGIYILKSGNQYGKFVKE